MKNMKKFVVYLTLIFGSLIMFFPFWYMLYYCFKNFSRSNGISTKWLPNNFLNFENFRLAFENAPFLQYFTLTLFNYYCLCDCDRFYNHCRTLPLVA